jgi:hypothetical protein
MAQAYLGATELNKQYLGTTQINYQQQGTTFIGILDEYPGAQAAYSVRRLYSEYNGPIMKVRRSNDNATLDIGWDSQGNLDTGSLTTFVGANTGFVTTWYDQSTNGFNLNQNTSNRQARIVISGDLQVPPAQGGSLTPTKPGIYFDYGGGFFQFYQASFESTLSQPYSWFDVISIQGQPSLVTDGILTDSYILRSGPFIEANAGSALTLGDSFQLGNQIYSAIFNNTTSKFGVDYTFASSYTSSLSTGSIGSNSLDGISVSLGEKPNNRNFIGYMSELILWPTDQSNNRTDIVAAQNDYYGVYS